MTTDAHHRTAATGDASVIDRRGVLRGTLLAGAAAGAAVVAMSPDAAHAADDDNVVIGGPNAAESVTTLTVGGSDGGSDPALALENADGPSLRLQALPHTWAGQLAVGEMAGTDLGPIVGVDLPEEQGGLTTTYLVTGADLANIATPFATQPTRVLDLRTAAGRDAILRRSVSDALTADGKLKAGQWIDIALAFTGPDYSMEAVFGNLLATGAARSGWAAVYPPGVQPPTSTLNFPASASMANGSFVGTASVQGYHAVRIFTSAEAWFVFDVTGGVTVGNVQTPLAQAARAAGGRSALARKMRKVLARTAR